MDGLLYFAIILQTSWTSTTPNTNVINRTDTTRKSKCFIIAGDRENSVFICRNWNPIVLLLVKFSTYFKKKRRWVSQTLPVICQIVSKTKLFPCPRCANTLISSNSILEHWAFFNCFFVIHHSFWMVKCNRFLNISNKILTRWVKSFAIRVISLRHRATVGWNLETQVTWVDTLETLGIDLNPIGIVFQSWCQLRLDLARHWNYLWCKCQYFCSLCVSCCCHHCVSYCFCRCVSCCRRHCVSSCCHVVFCSSSSFWRYRQDMYMDFACCCCWVTDVPGWCKFCIFS